MKRFPPSLHKMLEVEVESGFLYKKIAGVDEVGRGCLAGPVVAASVILPTDPAVYHHDWLSNVTDSKALKAKDRERLSAEILKWATCSIASASPEEIDSLNIHYATFLAMERAIEGLNQAPDFVLVDGKFVPKKLSISARAVIKGDSKSLAIACASIIAKVFRDNLMAELDIQFPGYGLATHKGYPTPVHVRALEGLGVSTIHRKSFAPVRERLPR